MARKIFPQKRNKIFPAEQNSGCSVTQKKAFMHFQVTPQHRETGVFLRNTPHFHIFPGIRVMRGTLRGRLQDADVCRALAGLGTSQGGWLCRCCSLWPSAAQETWSDLNSSSCISPGELRPSRGAKRLQPSGKTFIPKLH